MKEAILRRSVLSVLVIREALMTSKRYEGGGEAIARRRQRKPGEGLPSRSDYAKLRHPAEVSPHG
jgi:hypothetical protein